MARITVTFEHPQGTLSQVLNIPDAHMTRLFTAFKSHDPTLTNAQVAAGLVRNWGEKMRSVTKQIETDMAVKAVAVQAIDVS